MKMSRLAVRTLRESPAEAEAISHQLLLRAGFIRRISSGVYSFLPLGMRTLLKISEIVRRELDEAGAQEVLLPALHPLDLWVESGRLAKMSDVLMRVQTKAGEFLLGPTHEEVVIASITPDISSYRDLPVIVHQIQTKFRDEARPRFGLARTKEFIMSDAYSFDADQEGMRSSYRRVYDAYERIFAAIGLPYVPVEADSGAMGGDVNHEFMSPSEIGEDHFAHCSSCGYAANIEAARRGAIAQAGAISEAVGEMRSHHTPGAPGVTDAIRALNEAGERLAEHEMLKCIATVDSTGAVVLLLVPGDREVRITGGLRLMEESELKESDYLVKGYIGPMGMVERGVRVIADLSVADGSSWATGANVADHHVVDARVGRDFTISSTDSIVVVVDGDPCPRCGSALSLVKGVEIGHTFQLGVTYSLSISSARYVDEGGVEQMYFMGCYGIGVTRLLAVVAEQFADDRGLNWPVSVAPYTVAILPLGAVRSEPVRETAVRLYDQLRGEGIDVILDDRDTSPGIMFADAELIGHPYTVVVGSKGLAAGNVEIRTRRDGSSINVSVEDAFSQLRALLG